MTEEKKTLDPNLVAAVRSQVLDELKSEDERKRQEKIRQREEDKKSRDSYVERMKTSDEPWVDIIGFVDTPQGVRVELDWNGAFVAYLRENGVRGTDDEQVVQRWITLLLRDMAEQMEEEIPEQSEYE